MLHFADLDKDLAQKYGATFINLNPPVVAALSKAQALDPQVAKLLLPDRVHPEPLAHWVMAETLLKGWHAPALVSSVTIDGHAGKVADVENATVDAVTQDKDGLHWTATEKSLPLAKPGQPPPESPPTRPCPPRRPPPECSCVSRREDRKSVV